MGAHKTKKNCLSKENFPVCKPGLTYKNKCEITATNKDGHTVRRNVSHCKRIPRPTTSGDGNVSDDSENYILPSRNSNSGPPKNQNREVDDQLMICFFPKEVGRHACR